MSYPDAAFVCMTCNRAPDRLWLVEQVVECFRQNAAEYPGRLSLVLVNDAPGQELVSDVPGVRILNVPRRFASLGEKLNHGVAAADADVILPHDDDDISLRWRVRLSVEHMAGADYHNPRAYFFLCADDPLKYEALTGYAHNCSAYRKSAWAAAGGYPPVSGPHDALMDAALRGGRAGVLALVPHLALSPAWAEVVRRWADRLPSSVRVADGPLPPDQTYFIYCWRRGSDFHHSAFHPDYEPAYRRYGERPVAQGCFGLRPHWRFDYAAMARDCVARSWKAAGKAPAS